MSFPLWDVDPNQSGDQYRAEAHEHRRPRSYCLWCGEPLPAGEEFCEGPGGECWHHFTASVEQDRLELDGE